MSQAFVIRRAAAGDEAAVARLFVEMFDYHRQFDPVFSLSATAGETYAKWFEQEMGDPGSVVLVAEVGGQVVAYCLAVVRRRTRVHEDRYQSYGEIDDLSVTKAYRHKGIGKALVTNAMEWLRLQGIHRIEVKVATTNELAGGFWRGKGFRPYMTSVWREV
jgi:ribosomal protein S18 acetylase RimI-like enzyme